MSRIEQIALNIEHSRTTPKCYREMFYNDFGRFIALKEKLERNGFYNAADKLSDFEEDIEAA